MPREPNTRQAARSSSSTQCRMAAGRRKIFVSISGTGYDTRSLRPACPHGIALRGSSGLTPTAKKHPAGISHELCIIRWSLDRLCLLLNYMQPQLSDAQ